MVREYDQDGSDSSTRRPAELEEEDPDAEEEDVRAQIKRLEEELNLMKQGPFGRNSEFMQSLPDDDRARLLKALEAEGTQAEVEELLDEDDEVEYVGDELGEFGEEAEAFDDEEGELEDEDEDEDGHVEETLAVTLRVPAQHKKYVKEFNDALLLAQNDIDSFAYHLDLWKWYLRCQQHIPGFSRFVDEDVWDFLWKSQTVYFPRPKQIVMLGKDMTSAGVNLDVLQSLDYIDALHTTGDTATAITTWEEKKPEVEFDEEVAPRFWETGVKIYAAVGRPRKAQDIASSAYSSGVLGVDAWIPVIQSWAVSKKPSSGSSLWACYLRLKQQHAEVAAKNGSSPSPRLPTQILGQISSALLQSGRQEMAISVFKDMLSTDANEQFDSAQVYATTLDKLQGVNKEVSEIIINRIGLAALTSFPGRFKNKFFFGAWIKWLIGEGKVDDAALVVELMQEYSIRPDAKHLNGIIGAWLREGSDSSRDRAEEMAWAMVHARIAQVKSRSAASPSSLTVSKENQYSHFRRLPRFLQRNIPPATIETFSVLLQRYTRLSDVAKSEHLTDIMTGPAQIKPNAFILNHWMYLSLRTQDLPAMWQRYNAVQREIEPDLETFAVLWEGCKKNLDRAVSTRTANYPTPRQLAREMKTWFDRLPHQKQLDAKEGMTRDLYQEIARSFCLHSDLPGAFAVLRLLQEMFDVYPHDDISRMVLMAVARMYPAQSPLASKPRRAAIRRRDSSYRAALGNLAGVMQGIADAKTTEAVARGVMVEEGEDVEVEVEDEDEESVGAGKVRLQTIQVFLAMVLKRRTRGASADLANELVVAGRALGMELDGEVVRRRVVEEAEVYEMAGAGAE